MFRLDGRAGKIIIGIIGAAVIVVAVILLTLLKTNGNNVTDAEVSAGITFLQQLEGRDIGDIESQVQAIRAEQARQLRQERAEEILNGEIPVWSMFQDYVLMGDSRAVGFTFYQLLPDDRVMAKEGATIKKIPEYLDTIKALNPTTLFMCYGLNDVLNNLGGSAEGYKAAYQEMLVELKKAAPNARIFISSILPAYEPGASKYEGYKNIPAYNQAIKEFCEENEGVYYVDNDEIGSDYKNLYEPDGVHVSKAFYSYWALNMILAQTEADDEEAEAAAAAA